MDIVDEAAKLPEFSPWISCIAAVSFHITKGHVVDSIHPRKHTEAVSPAFLSSIARLALPDMTIDSEGDVKFTFRVRGPQDSNQYFYGCVFFRQQRDANEKRGYMQKSIVVLTKHHEFVPVASEFAHVIGPVFFSYACNAEVLERACVDVESWPKPTSRVPLTVAGTVLHPTQQFPQPSHMFPDIPLFTTFGSLAVSLWPLWELALTGQSILVLGPTPDRCSKAVLGIASLISPVPLSYDFRPFLTVLDHDFSRLCDVKASAGPCIVGGSNPFLLKCFEHFPNVVSLGSQSLPPVLQSGGLSPSTSDFVLFRKTHTLRSLLKNNKWETPLLITRDKQLVQRDDRVLQRLKQAGATNQQKNDFLRACFYSHTKRFLEPLESFLRIRVAGSVCRAYHEQPKPCETFELDDFLHFLSNQQAVCSDDAAAKRFPAMLYSRFIQGPNFQPWLELEKERMKHERFIIMRTLIFETDTQALLGIAGIVQKVKQHIEEEHAKGGDAVDTELCDRMQQHYVELLQQAASSNVI